MIGVKEMMQNISLKLAVDDVSLVMDRIIRARQAVHRFDMADSDRDTIDDALAKAYSDLKVIIRAYGHIK